MNSFKILSALIITIIFIIGLCTLLSASIRSDICGDVNDDSSINLLDVSALIDYLYIGGQPPVNLAVCDVNSSGQINILDITFLISYLYMGGPDPYCDGSPIVGSMTSYSNCKTFSAKDTYPSDVDCLEWEYLDNWELHLTHINGGFNCCPESLFADISLSGDTIIIIEHEAFGTVGPCYCLCLFDVDYVFTTIPVGIYTVKIIGMYLDQGDDTLIATIDLNQSYTGSYCVDRDHYPWGFGSPQIEGELTGYGGCNMKAPDDSTLEEDCIIYQYGYDSTLTLTHLNDLFNCCPDSLYAVIDIQGNTINIVEYEDISGSGGCDCTCLYDLYYTIDNLPPGLWNIRVDNEYYYHWLGDDEIIEFEVNLMPGDSGSYCVDRSYLPWIY